MAFVLGLHDRLANLAAPASDEIGLSLERIPNTDNRWEGDVPIPTHQSVVPYRYKSSHRHKTPSTTTSAPPTHSKSRGGSKPPSPNRYNITRTKNDSLKQCQRCTINSVI